jgi:hypothetical protein
MSVTINIWGDEMKEVLFVIFYSTMGGQTVVTSMLTAEFDDRASCLSSSQGFIKIANEKKILVTCMCSPKLLDAKTPTKTPPNATGRSSNLSIAEPK